MDEQITSSISLGDEPGFDLEEPIEVRHCEHDKLYPIALEGITKGGHDVSISLTVKDAWAIHDAVETYL